eukprot:129654-Alexandrium_andersonii.AAC.1
MRRPAAARSVGCAASAARSAATPSSTCGDWLAPLAARASAQGSVSVVLHRLYRAVLGAGMHHHPGVRRV